MGMKEQLGHTTSPATDVLRSLQGSQEGLPGKTVCRGVIPHLCQMRLPSNSTNMEFA